MAMIAMLMLDGVRGRWTMRIEVIDANYNDDGRQ
jgi:hypothetical protein